MARRYMVRCDMEGTSGVVSYEQVEPGRSEYEFGQSMFMADLLALLEGLKAGGADEIVIYDEHYYGRNIDLSQLPGYATAICGKPPYRADWAGGLDSSFSGVVLLGFHSKAETPGGLLPHSYELEIEDLTLNGISVGEIGIEAAIAGDYGVPVVLVTGDSAGVNEARELIPGVTGIAVKKSCSETGGICYPIASTTAMIRKAGESVVRSISDIKPYSVSDKVELKIKLRECPYLEAVKRIYGSDIVGDRTLVIRGGSATEVWAEYWDRKVKCQSEAGLLGGSQ
ncbi:MAG: M55 family metallopeptidase [Armatimonadota bacterium]